MDSGKRLRNIRMHYNLTQEVLGKKLGFSSQNSRIRIAQYEAQLRSPKAENINRIADILGIVPEALQIPSVNNETELMHLLFALEEFFNMKVNEQNGVVYLTFDELMQPLLSEWLKKFKEYQNDDISEYEYKEWQYKYSGKK